MTFLSRRENLSIKELYDISKVFVELGITKIRLTGGEPLVRSGILGLISSLNGLQGLEELTLTTNGALLEKFAKPLKDAGITRINISLDTLQRPKFRKLSRTGELDQVLLPLDGAGDESAFTRLRAEVSYFSQMQRNRSGYFAQTHTGTCRGAGDWPGLRCGSFPKTGGAVREIGDWQKRSQD